MIKQEKLRSTVKGHIISDKLFYYAAENKRILQDPVYRFPDCFMTVSFLPWKPRQYHSVF